MKIELVNMPFASLSRPSIGLTQLKTVTEKTFGNRVSVNINYLNHKFGALLGNDAYGLIANSMVGHVTGFGEWFFRQAAFPDLPDNRAAFFSRFGRQLGRESMHLIDKAIEPVRQRLEATLDELIVQHGLDQADMVGMTSMFFQNLANVALARRLRRFRSDQIILMGGANCEEEMGIEWTKQIPEIDFFFSGHGLISFPQFIGHILAGERAKTHGIKGIYSRENVGVQGALAPADDSSRAATKPPPGFWKSAELDINEVVELDYDDYFESYDRWLGGLDVVPDLPFETSRGCWWGAKAHCTFCGLNGGDMAYRAMEPALARTYIGKLLDKYAHRAALFGCVDNIMPKEYFETVFRDLRPPEGVELFYEVKADLTEQQVRILSESHIRHIQPGVESLATSTLKIMRKGTTAFGNLKLLLNCLKYDISPQWNLLLGFPGETAEVYANYLKFLPNLFHLKPPSGAFPVRFDRFSPYFTNPERYNLELVPYEYYSYSMPFAESAIKNIAYYFQDANIEAEYMADLATSLSSLTKLVSQWQERWSGKDGSRPPVLRLSREDGKHWVTDSRGRMSFKYPISEAEFELLCASLDAVEEGAVRQSYGDTVDALLGKGLLFVERGRVMNIVSDVEPDAEAVYIAERRPGIAATAY